MSMTNNEKLFDQQMKQLHEASLANLSPATLAQLRQRRHAASLSGRNKAGRWQWLLGTACAAVFAVSIGLNFNTPQFMVSAGDDVALFGDNAVSEMVLDGEGMVFSAYEEDPDLYLWLGSVNAQTFLAME